MRHNNLFKMQDLFMNPSLAGVFPQFRTVPNHRVHSFAEVEQRMLDHLSGVLGGTKQGRGELTVQGIHSQVLRQVQGLKASIEALFNNTGGVVQGLRNNTNLYLPYATLGQIGSLDTVAKKTQAIKQVLDNLAFNPDFQGRVATTSQYSQSYLKLQEAWKKRVGFKE